MTCPTLPPLLFETPKAMTSEDISATQDDFVQAAINAISAGCDGIEIHAGNGYLFDQFHHSNGKLRLRCSHDRKLNIIAVNQRNDEYGGSITRRCRFTLETVDKLCSAIGSGRVGVRLSPFGVFNETKGEDRLEQWLHLCSELSKRNIAYV
jgi:2,4-dienoyl-CoA reductase-like NADH-dependent reductase (Old Yellow Enzyme family)